jgi:hypothetical protein
MKAMHSAALAAFVAGTVASAQDEIANRYPGVRIHRDGPITMVYGAPMGVSGSQAAAHEAAEAWLAENAPDLGVSLRLVREIPLAGRTVLHYEQVVSGLAVDGSLARIIVMHDPNRVTFFSGKLLSGTSAQAGGRELAASIDAERALAAVRALPAAANMVALDEPALVAFAGVGLDQPARAAWKVTGSASSGRGEAYAFYVDASSGEFLHRRSIIFHGENPVDVSGTVTGYATPGTEAPSSTNPAVLMPLDQLQVSIGAATALTGPTGAYTLPHGGAAPVTVDADLLSPWVRVINNAGPTESLSQNVTPPGPADFVFNASQTEFGVAQVNALIHSNLTHDYFTARAPGFGELDERIDANVNFNASCNAFYNPSNKSINMFRAGFAGGFFCENTSFSAILAHEYGHFVHTELGIFDQPFGEGFADSISHLLYDVQEIGVGVTTIPGFSRDPIVANVQWPCSSGSAHFCGQVLSGAWYRMRQNLGASLGSQAGLETTRQLHVEWTLVTIGNQGNQAAGPGTAIEVLMIDDNDGNLANGTPHYGEICAAFGAHGIDCPPITACYPDCDTSTGAGVLDVFDFLCFQDAFTSMDPYADCTGDTLFDVFDFLCFQDAFITGCP